MMKENKGKLIISSLLILAPMFFGILMWNQLPDTMTIHWGVEGTADGFGAKIFAVTMVPILLLLTHWLCLYFTGRDHGNKGQNRKVTGMLFWIMPILSICTSSLIYAAAFGWEINPAVFVIPMCGILFIFIGNYMPKCKQNSTIGIKISWTLKNEENWNVTHRFAGKVWVAGGFLILFTMLLPETMSMVMFFITLFLLIVVPVVYSYRYYRKQKEAGTWTENWVIYDEKSSKTAKMISFVIIIPILILVFFVTFTGDIEYQYGKESFTIEADYWSDVTVKYENIKNITYRNDVRAGSRTSGFGSPRLGMGTFENREFGYYTRYCYERCKASVVLQVGEKMLVINGKDEAATKQIYETLRKKVN